MSVYMDTLISYTLEHGTAYMEEARRVAMATALARAMGVGTKTDHWTTVNIFNDPPTFSQSDGGE